MALFVAAACIGVACRFLQPKQPESAVGTILLILAMLALIVGFQDVYVLTVKNP